MRVMVLVKATEDSEKGILPTTWMTEMLEAMGKFNDELRNAGILRAADGLKPSSQGKRVAFDGPRRRVIDGAAPIPCRDRARSKFGRFTRWLICDENLTPKITEIHDQRREKLGSFRGREGTAESRLLLPDEILFEHDSLHSEVSDGK
jgi:YCII-related domain